MLRGFFEKMRLPFLAILIGITAVMKKESKATVNTPIKDLKGKESIEHYNAVLLEGIDSKMKQVIEGMETTKESLTKKVDEFRDEVNQRFDMIENVVLTHSGQLQNIEATLADHGKQLADHGKQLVELKGDVKEIKAAVKHLDEKFTEKIDDHEDRIVILEKNLTTHP